MENALVPSLSRSESPSLVRDTLIAKESLQLCSGPLQDTFIALCVGQQAHGLRNQLCERILSPDKTLSMATMRFFDVVCGLYHPHATESLILAHVKTQPAAAVASASTADDALSRCVFEPILNSFPAAFTHERSSGSSLDSYTLHARGIIAQVAAQHAALGVAPDTERFWLFFLFGIVPFFLARLSSCLQLGNGSRWIVPWVLS